MDITIIRTNRDIGRDLGTEITKVDVEALRQLDFTMNRREEIAIAVIAIAIEITIARIETIVDDQKNKIAAITIKITITNDVEKSEKLIAAIAIDCTIASNYRIR